MEELGLVPGAHAEIFVHFGVLGLDLEALLLGEVGDLAGVDLDGAFDGRLVLVRLHNVMRTLSRECSLSLRCSTLVSLSGCYCVPESWWL